MKILILTFYFPPDLSAGSFRMKSFVEALRRRGGSEVCVDVVTTLPNRYHSYSKSAPTLEESGSLSVTRLPLRQHRSGFRDQALAFRQYYRGVLRHLADREFDVVFATSSRLMTAVLGSIVARKRRKPLFLDIRDIFSDTLDSVLRFPLDYVVAPIFHVLEKRTLKSADVVNLVSPGFHDYFARYLDEGKLRFYSNGIDPEFRSFRFDERSGPASPGLIVYAGNIGEGQGLHRIVPAAARTLGDDWRFIIVGDGGLKPALARACGGLSNVELRDPVDREGLKEIYGQADVLFLHLNDYPAFRRVLPSKIFEYAATGKPILGGVTGYAASFLQDNVINSAVFAPCDAEGLVKALGGLDRRNISRDDFIQRFSREKIMDQMADDVLALAGGRK